MIASRVNMEQSFLSVRNTNLNCDHLPIKLSEMESKLKFLLLFSTSQVLLYSARSENLTELASSAKVQVLQDPTWENEAGIQVQERVDISETLAYMPLLLFIAANNIVTPIYRAGARAGNNLWEEASYAIEVLGGSQRNRTSDTLKENLWKDAKATVYIAGGAKGHYDTSYEGRLHGGRLHPHLPCRSFENPINSVFPEASCVRLFQSDNCKGPSLAVYPGSKAALRPSQFLSMGRCLRSEFDFSTFYTRPEGGISVEKNLRNVKAIPDFLLDISGAVYFPRFSSQPHAPSNRSKGPYYFFEQGGRLKWSGGIIFRYYPTVGNQTKLKESKRWSELEKREGDDVGFVFPPVLGGSTKDIKNIFAQSRENLNEWNVILGDIVGQAERFKNNVLGSFEGVEVSLTMAYENERTNRPFGFYYYFMFRTDSSEFANRHIQYGFVRN